LGFGQSAEIDIVFNDSENRKYAECRVDEGGKKEKLLLYYDGETISGKVSEILYAYYAI
jgi:vacuolar protein sorting-associated protein 26